MAGVTQLLGAVVKFAYADPPYVGQARRYYGVDRSRGRHLERSHPDYAGEVDHAELIARLVDEFPDGWALSLSERSLRTILPMCPDDVRVMAWVKSFHNWKPGVWPSFAWEPVILRGGRRPAPNGYPPNNWLRASMTTRRGVVGAKPDEFCWWVFRCLNAQTDDILVDLFPGSGAVGRAWDSYAAQTVFPIDEVST